jgi:serine/threonine-protein kinase
MPDRTKTVSRFAEVRDALAPRYALKHVVGEGGMATVYLAEQLADGIAVAIKVLKPEYSVSILADRFQQEIGFLADLEHANILPVLASAQVGNLLYYVMPFARDGSLEDRLRASGPLPFDGVLNITRDIATALDYAHERGVVHRDIKPGNILFHEGRPKLCDFGVARAIVRAGGERLSTSGLIVGTPSYMSPEQARGLVVDGRSDLYALASVVFEALAGEPAFTGRTTQIVLARQVHERPPSLRVLRPDVSLQAERAVNQAMDKDPNRRPQTASEFVAKLAPA